ncbi:hypothetical protein Hanom_Chr17g01562601 [Helianthus anomalus]
MVAGGEGVTVNGGWWRESFAGSKLVHQRRREQRLLHRLLHHFRGYEFCWFKTSSSDSLFE